MGRGEGVAAEGADDMASGVGRGRGDVFTIAPSPKMEHRMTRVGMKSQDGCKAAMMNSVS